MFNLYPYLNVNDLNLDWIIGHFKEFIDEISSLEEWRRTHEEEYQQLLAWQTAINDGNFPPSMYTAMQTWFENNALELVGNMVKFISVEVNDLGYFVIKIPDQWTEIYFRTTGYDMPDMLGVDYGHLAIGF